MMTQAPAKIGSQERMGSVLPALSVTGVPAQKGSMARAAPAGPMAPHSPFSPLAPRSPRSPCGPGGPTTDVPCLTDSRAGAGTFGSGAFTRPGLPLRMIGSRKPRSILRGPRPYPHSLMAPSPNLICFTVFRIKQNCPGGQFSVVGDRRPASN